MKKVVSVVFTIILVLLTACSSKATSDNVHEFHDVDEIVDDTAEDDDYDMAYDEEDYSGDVDENSQGNTYGEETTEDVSYDSCFSGKVCKNIHMNIPEDWLITDNYQQGSDGWHTIYESPDQSIRFDIQCCRDENHSMHDMILDNIRSKFDIRSTFQGVEVDRNLYEETNEVFGGRDCVVIKTYNRYAENPTDLNYYHIFEFWLEDIGVSYTVQGYTNDEEYDFRPVLESIDFSNLENI